MLKKQWSYNQNNITNGWWQARVVDISYCLVLNLEIDPQNCPFKENIVDNQEISYQYYAFGTFTIVADAKPDNFEEYLEKKFENLNNFTSITNSGCYYFLQTAKY